MPQQISAEVLRELKQDAEKHLGYPVKDAVITVPAYFNDAQRSATKQAGEQAGFTVRRIINEPTAAALAYGLNSDVNQYQKVAVFDLGGGTFDISVLEIGFGVWEVKSTNGDTFLGGDDFDREITNLLVRTYLNEFDHDLRDDPSSMQRMREAAERAKCELSTSLETKIALTFVHNEQPTNFQYTLTRQKFESLLEPYLKKIEACCKQALTDANMTPADINEVVLVGGSTRTPIIKNLAKKIFAKEPNTSVDPDEVVALGAAIQGAILSGEKKGMVLVDVTPLSLGIETEDDEMDVLIPRNSPIPCTIKEIYTTTEDEQAEVDVYVFQGESRNVRKNRLLGQFVLSGIEPVMAGDPQIEVRFHIDTDGILQVSAKNLATGSEQSIVIKDTSSLDASDLEKYSTTQGDADFDDDDDEDEDDNEEVTTEELVAAAESLLQDTTSGLREFSTMLEAETVNTLRSLKEKLATALDSEDLGSIEESMGELLVLWDEVESKLD
jgi:molecular chaperone DnaK